MPGSPGVSIHFGARRTAALSRSRPYRFRGCRIFGTDQALTPIRNRHFGAVAPRHLGGIGLDLMLAIAPNDQPDAGVGRVPEPHRWAMINFHSDGIVLRHMPSRSSISVSPRASM